MAAVRTFKFLAAQLHEPAAPCNSATVGPGKYDPEHDVLVVKGTVGEFKGRTVRIPVHGNVKWYVLDSATAE